MAALDLDANCDGAQSVVDYASPRAPGLRVETRTFNVFYVKGVGRSEGQVRVVTSGHKSKARVAVTANPVHPVVHSLLMGASRVFGLFGHETSERSSDDVVADRIERAIERANSGRSW